MRKCVVVLTFLLVASGCSGGSDSAEPETLQVQATSVALTTTAVATTTVPPTTSEGGWDAELRYDQINACIEMMEDAAEDNPSGASVMTEAGVTSLLYCKCMIDELEKRHTGDERLSMSREAFGEATAEVRPICMTKLNISGAAAFVTTTTQGPTTTVPPTTTQGPTTTSGLKGAWKTFVEQDPMDDSWLTALVVEAVETFTVNSEEYRPQLALVCREGSRFYVTVHLGGKFASFYADINAGIDTTSLRYRAGNKPAELVDAPRSENHETAYLEDGAQIIRDLSGASQMLVEVNLVSGFGKKEFLFTFDTRGLDAHLPLLTKHCPGQL